jgi:non-ribosomal peptide synthetase component F
MPPTGESEALPPAQREVRARCRHPSGDFVPFDEAWVNGSLVSGFERHATAGPGRVAIRSPTCTLTFGDVEVLAARLAAALIGSRGDNSEPVALVFGHDAPIVAAMFGTLRAGKFYVPIDPSYPADRLRYMLDDARAAVVVCSRAHLPLARELAGRTRGVLCLDALEDASDARAVPRPALAPDRPALLLYTSGSTGRPKGFVQTHGNVLHDVMQYTNAAHFSPDDRFLLVSSFSFADSIRTIYSSLLNGARLLPFDLRRYGMPALADWLVDERITVYRSVPTVFRHFARTLGGTEIFDDLRLIYLAGEPVVRRDVELARRHFPETCFLVNRIGTGEALTFASYFLDRHTAVHGPSVPVGYPVPGKDVLLLDESGREIEGRGIGEMVIRSRFLSPGYWHRPDLTDAAFSTVPDRRPM